MSSAVIKVENLSKKYILGELGYNTLYHSLQSRIAKIFGKEDPNKKIGSKTLHLNEEFWALKNINFEIKNGGRIGIIGRNGAGKSTLLKILSKVTSPTTGSIKIKGRVASLLEVGTGFHPELSGRENIYLNGTILGMTRREIDRKLDEIIDFAEVELFIDTPVKRYSSGMYVKLAFAVAAHLDPEILVVDEVLAVGDASFQKKALGKMEDVSKGEGRTVLFVSHNMGAISSLCQECILLNKGEIEFYGSAGEAIDLYLNNSRDTDNILEWTINSDLPFSQIVKIYKYYVVNESNAIQYNLLYNNEKYRVVIECELYTNEPDLVFFVSYYNEEGTLIFVSDIHDDGDYNRDKMTKGKKNISTAIPVELFSNKNYYIEVTCAIYHKGWAILPNAGHQKKFKFFRSIDNGTKHNESHHPFTGSTRPGLLAPVIKWDIHNN